MYTFRLSKSHIQLFVQTITPLENEDYKLKIQI